MELEGAVWGASGLDASSLALLLESSHEAAFVRAPDGTILFWNLGAEDLYGWSKADALGQLSHELLATDFGMPLVEIERQLLAGGRWEGLLRRRTRTGALVTVESRWVMHVAPGRRLAAVLELNRDVSARVAAEERLAAEAERFRAIFDASLDAIFLTRPDGGILAANGAAQEMFGRSEAEIIAGGRELIVDATDPRLAAALRERVDHGRVRANMRGLRSDGSTFELELSSVVFHDGSGEALTSMIVRDVTDRTEALKAARESEARFHALADAVTEAVFLHEEGRILDVNRAACALTGYAEKELRSMHVLELLPPAAVAQGRELLQAPTEEPVEALLLTKDGREVRVEGSGRTVVSGGRTLRVVAARATRLSRAGFGSMST